MGKALFRFHEDLLSVKCRQGSIIQGLPSANSSLEFPISHQLLKWLQGSLQYETIILNFKSGTTEHQISLTQEKSKDSKNLNISHQVTTQQGLRGHFEC